MLLQTFQTLPHPAKRGGKKEGSSGLASLSHFKFAASSKETLVDELESSLVERHVVISFPRLLSSTTSATTTPHPQVTRARRQNNKARANGHFSPTKLSYLARLLPLATSHLPPPPLLLFRLPNSCPHAAAATSLPVCLAVCFCSFATKANGLLPCH